VALTFTSRASAGSSSLSTSVTSASFTPAANSKLYVLAWVQTDSANPSSNTVLSTPTGGSLTYTLKASSGPTGGASSRVYLWEATAPGSPSAMTVGISSGGSSYIAYGIFDISGTSPAMVSGQCVAATNADFVATHTTGTLPSTTVSGNMVICAAGANRDSFTAIPLPATFTTQINASGGANFEAIRVSNHSAVAITSTSFSLSTDNLSAGSVLFEMSDGAAPALPPELVMAPRTY
jgi:hypothetical protein